MNPLTPYPSQDRLKVATITAAALVGVPFLMRFAGVAAYVPFFPMLSILSLGAGAVLFLKVKRMKARKEPTLQEAIDVMLPEQKAQPNEAGVTPIELYPSGPGRRNALIIGGLFAFLGMQTAVWSADDTPPYLMGLFLVIAACAVFPAVMSYLNPQPSFAADADGFSVRGGPKKSWDEFRSVKVQTISYGFFPIAKNVVIKTGKSMLGGRVQITGTHQSGTAAEMAQEIAGYAHAVRVMRQRGTMMAAPKRAQPVRPEAPKARPVAPRPAAPADPLMARVQGAGGAIERVPSLSERIFGRRKVM